MITKYIATVAWITLGVAALYLGRRLMRSSISEQALECENCGNTVSLTWEVVRTTGITAGDVSYWCENCCKSGAIACAYKGCHETVATGSPHYDDWMATTYEPCQYCKEIAIA